MTSFRYVLDTDLFGVFWAGTSPLLAGRVAAVAPGELAIPVITVEESLGGWYAGLRRTNQPSQLEYIYERLARSVLELSRFPIVSYTRAAMAEYDRLDKLKLNVRRNDLRIAAIAIVNNATVVTRNVRDFGRVQHLAVEDWSAP